MADKGADPAAGGEEAKEEEKKQSCGEKCESCIMFTFKVSLQTIRACLAFVWYPLKEQCEKCCLCCDKTLNPWKDEGYSHV